MQHQAQQLAHTDISPTQHKPNQQRKKSELLTLASLSVGEKKIFRMENMNSIA
jgi:hypothetical protein